MQYLTGLSLLLIIIILISLNKNKKLKSDIKNNDITLFLYDITFSNKSFREKLKSISHAIMGRLEFDYVSFFILDKNKNVGIIQSNVPEFDCEELIIFTKELLLNKDKPIILHSDKTFLKHGINRFIKYAYFVPLKEKNEVIGGILLEKENKNNIKNIESMVFQSIVAAASKAFAFIIFAYNLNESAYKDPLTGTNNRKVFDLIKSPLEGTYTAVMCDIDHFKKVNDIYGNDAGDEVLKLVSNLLVESTRTNDKVIRMGGEEFLLLLADIEAEQIIRRINVVRKEIENYTIIYEGKEIKVTLSFGLCDTNFSNELNTLQVYADKALYHSKNNGRNKATIFRQEFINN